MSKTNETVAAISMDQKLKVKEIENIYTYLKYIKEMLPSGLKKTIEISLTIVYMIYCNSSNSFWDFNETRQFSAFQKSPEKNMTSIEETNKQQCYHFKEA